MTLTKEWLLKTISELEEERDAIPEAVNEDAATALAAMKLALASMTAEPVAWTTGGYSQNIGCNFGEKEPGEAPCIAAVYWDRNVFRHHADCEEPSDKWLAEAIKNTGAKPLYFAPPAPVVPDAIPKLKDGQRFKYVKDGIRYSANYANGWNQCCAAMLQGAEPVSQRDELPANVIDALEKALQAMSFMGDTLNALDAVCEEDVEYVTPAFKAVRQVLEGNSPAIPDGWVACSERMPPAGGSEQSYVLAADFKNHYWPNLPNTQVGVYGDWFSDGNPTWDDGDGNDLHLKEVTHWMPLPAAPQQEAK